MFSRRTVNGLRLCWTLLPTHHLAPVRESGPSLSCREAVRAGFAVIDDEKFAARYALRISPQPALTSIGVASTASSRCCSWTARWNSGRRPGAGRWPLSHVPFPCVAGHCGASLRRPRPVRRNSQTRTWSSHNGATPATCPVGDAADQ
jgi:hypothetical protein